MWNSVWKSGNFHMAFTCFSHLNHMKFHMHVKFCHVKGMWKACEINVKKGVKNVILFTQCFTCSIRQVHTPNMWSTVWDGGCFHAVLIRFSHDNFMCMWNFTMWKACEKNGKDVKKITFSHRVSHAPSDRETFIILVWNFLGYYQCYTRSWHPT